MGAALCSGCNDANFDVLNCDNITTYMYNVKTQAYGPAYNNDAQRCDFSRKTVLKKALKSFLDFHSITDTTQSLLPPLPLKDSLLSTVFPKSKFLPYIKEGYEMEPGLDFNIFKYIKESSFYSGFCLLTTYCAAPEEHKLELIAEKNKCNDYPEGYGSYLVCQTNGFIKLFDGIFKGGEFTEGIIIDSDYIYIGEYDENGFTGKGKLFYHDQTILQGTFETGHLNGANCTMFAPYNYYYVGDCFSGSMHGKGKLTFLNNANCLDYEGDLVYGAPDGQGTMRYKNGSIYCGHWKEGQYHGNGKYTSLDHSEYEGEYLMGKKNGKGVLKTPNKSKEAMIDKIEGEWKEDLLICKEKVTASNENGDDVQ